MAMYEAGYGSSSRLYERAASQLGMTPATYRRGGQATDIRYTVADCPLGRLLLAGTERGICAVRLGDAGEALEAGLAPRAIDGRPFGAQDPGLSTAVPSELLEQSRHPPPQENRPSSAWM